VPVAKYFAFVGSALAVLLLMTAWWCPEPPAIFADRPQIVATAAIRIRSERKWPEKIELDTSQPTMVPPLGDVSSVAVLPAPLPPEQTAAKPRLEALAQLNPDTRLTAGRHQAVQIKHRLARTIRSSHVARASVANRQARLDADDACCQFGWADNGQPSPNRTSPKRAAPTWSTGWLALSQR
jgi:hypothetical protein